jgi:hypothetical protein
MNPVKGSRPGRPLLYVGGCKGADVSGREKLLELAERFRRGADPFRSRSTLLRAELYAVVGREKSGVWFLRPQTAETEPAWVTFSLLASLATEELGIPPVPAPDALEFDPDWPEQCQFLGIEDPEAVPAGLSEVDPCTRAWLSFLRNEGLGRESLMFKSHSSGGVFPDVWEASAVQCELSARERIQTGLTAEKASEGSGLPKSPNQAMAQADCVSDREPSTKGDGVEPSMETKSGCEGAAVEPHTAAALAAQLASTPQALGYINQSLRNMTEMSSALQELSSINLAIQASDSAARMVEALGAEINELLLPCTTAVDAAQWAIAGEAADLRASLEAFRSCLTTAVQPLADMDLQAIEGITSSLAAIQASTGIAEMWRELDLSHAGLAAAVVPVLKASTPVTAPSSGEVQALREPTVEGRPNTNPFSEDDPERRRWVAMSQLVSQLLGPLSSNLLEKMPAKDATSEEVHDWMLDLCVGVFDCRATILAARCGTEHGAAARERHLREFENSILGTVAESCLTFIQKPTLQMRLGQRREYWMGVGEELARGAEGKGEDHVGKDSVGPQSDAVPNPVKATSTAESSQSMLHTRASHEGESGVCKSDKSDRRMPDFGLDQNTHRKIIASCRKRLQSELMSVWNAMWLAGEAGLYNGTHGTFIRAFKEYAIDLLEGFARAVEIKDIDAHLTFLRTQLAPAILEWIEPARSSWIQNGSEVSVTDYTATGEWERWIGETHRSFRVEHPPALSPADLDVYAMLLSYQVQLRYENPRVEFHRRVGRALEDRTVPLEHEALERLPVIAPKTEPGVPTGAKQSSGMETTASPSAVAKPSQREVLTAASERRGPEEPPGTPAGSETITAPRDKLAQIATVRAARRHGFEADMDRHRAITEVVSRHAPHWRENSASWKTPNVLKAICRDLDEAKSSDESGSFEIPASWKIGKTESLRGTPIKGWSDALVLAPRKLVVDQIKNSLLMVRRSELKKSQQQLDEPGVTRPAD